jgi:hypothetical protein
MFDPLAETALRVFTLRDPAPPDDDDEDDEDANDWESERPERAYPREALVWDTETLTSAEQRLLVLTYRLYSTDPGETQPRCIDEGVVYPDDLPNRDPAGYRTLRSWANTHEWAAVAGLSRPDGGRTIRCERLSWWLEQRLCLYGYGHRDHCDVVGFNLLFDLGRVAQHWEAAKGDFYGGWWLGFIGDATPNGGWESRYWAPRLRVKALDPRRARYRWSAQTDQKNAWRGSQARIVDLRTLSYTLTDADHSLESACREFRVRLPSTGESFTKAEVEHGVITPDLLDYARLDVEATAELYFACLRELDHHPGVDLDAPWLYSPASVGAKYLDAIGIRRPLEKFTEIDPIALGWQRPRRGKRRRRPPSKDSPARGDLDPRVLGWAMSAFYGGRAEARIVRTPVPVTLVDFRSMYPAVNALLDTRSILTADRVGIETATDHVRLLLDAHDLVEACYRPEIWRDQIGVTLVEVEPGGATLPVRAHYDPDSDDYGIGVNPYTLDATTWYALPDLIAARLLGKSDRLKVHRAIRLRGEDTQPGLTPVRLRGDAQLDPRSRDPFLTMVEERHRILQNPDLDDRERDWRERFLKVTANATSYGLLARFDRREHARPVPVTVYGPDHGRLNVRVAAPEDPGPYCFPPIAASITAAARLMLTLLEHAITKAGGSYAFCDTDALAITRAGTTSPGVDEATIRRVLDRFEPLNPYDAEILPGSPWQVKHESLTQPVHCYAISAKRYALYHLDQAGQPQLVDVADDTDPADDDTTLGQEGGLVDWSEHGLGLYLDPTTTADHDHPPRDTEGRRVWVSQAWDWILRDAHGSTPPSPKWAGRYAVTRYTVTGPRTEAWFAGYNQAHPSPEERIRPGCFGLLAHPQPAVVTDVHPTAEYEPRPTHWPLVPWYDRATGTPAHLFILEGVDPDELADLLARGAIPTQTLKDLLTRYRLRAEHKSLTRHGATARRDTLGPLQRRPVESRRILQDLIGKEANNLLERLSGELTDPAEYRTDYTTRHGDRWQLTVETLRTLNITHVAALSGIDRRTIQRAIRATNPTRPHARTRNALTPAAAKIVGDILSAAGQPRPGRPVPILVRYLEWTTRTASD